MDHSNGIAIHHARDETRRIPRSRIKHGADSQTNIALEFRLSYAWSLEVQLVKEHVALLRHCRRWAALRSRAERSAQRDHSAKPVGAQHRRGPGQRRTPIVAGDHRLLRP